MDADELRATARMARLAVGPQEIDALGQAVERMLQYFTHLKSLDVGSLSPTTHALPAFSGLREDRESADLRPQSLLDNAPEREDRFIVVPNVL